MSIKCLQLSLPSRVVLGRVPAAASLSLALSWFALSLSVEFLCLEGCGLVFEYIYFAWFGWVWLFWFGFLFCFHLLVFCFLGLDFFVWFGDIFGFEFVLIWWLGLVVGLVFFVSQSWLWDFLFFLLLEWVGFVVVFCCWFVLISCLIVVLFGLVVFYLGWLLVCVVWGCFDFVFEGFFAFCLVCFVLFLSWELVSLGCVCKQKSKCKLHLQF